MTPGDPNVALEIELVGKEAIVVHWEDGHRSEFPAAYLRMKCPCVTCVNEPETAPGKIEMGMSLPVLPKKARPGVYPVDAEAVGHYAVRFDWSDGHQTGIYSFNYLRSLCPCDACLSRK